MLMEFIDLTLLLELIGLQSPIFLSRCGYFWLREFNKVGLQSQQDQDNRTVC